MAQQIKLIFKLKLKFFQFCTLHECSLKEIENIRKLCLCLVHLMLDICFREKEIESTH